MLRVVTVRFRWQSLSGMGEAVIESALSRGRRIGDEIEMTVADAAAFVAGLPMSRRSEPSVEEISRALHPASRARWRAAGSPVHTVEQYTARRAVCDGCIDPVCAACPKTALARWLPTEDCPLGLWPKVGG